MATVYTDGNGNYFQPGNANAGVSTMTDVETFGVGQGHGTTPMLTSSLPLAGWSVAPNLTDIGGGVWWPEGGTTLVDPSYAESQGWTPS